MQRRDFIKTACATCAAGVGALWILQACTPAKYVTRYNLTGKTLSVKKEEFVLTKDGKGAQRKFILVKPEKLLFPIVIYRISDNEFKSYMLQCTHQGCELAPYETAMVCPCHGAEFNTKGEVTNGPAETNLKPFETTSDHENIYIQL